MDASLLLATLAKDPALLAGVAELLSKQGKNTTSDTSLSTQPRGRSILPADQQQDQDSTPTPAQQSQSHEQPLKSNPVVNNHNRELRSWSPHHSSHSRSSSPRQHTSDISTQQHSPPPARKPREGDVESSYQQGGTGRRGGRGERTAMEKLRTREKKNEYVCKHGHWFGCKHGCWFNPYSSDSVNEKLCLRILRPRGQAGRGEFLIHEAMGLKDDYDWFLDIRGSVRKAAIKHRPRNANPDSNVTWKNYSSGDRKKIYDYMYSQYPFLFHFHDESGEDCWAVRDMIQQYLTQSKSYTTKKSRDRYLRRNASHADKVDQVSESDTTMEHATGLVSDYHMNAATNRDSSSSGSSQSLGNGVSKETMTQPKTGSSRADARDARHADKVVAREQERAARGNVQKGPAELPTKDPKGKQRAPVQNNAPSGPETTFSTNLSDEEGVPAPPSNANKRRRVPESDSEDDSAVRIITKKVNIAPTSATEKGSSSKAPSGAKQKAGKSAGRATRTRKNIEPEHEPEQEAEQEAEQELELPEPEPRKRLRPKMRPQAPPSPGPSNAPSESMNANPSEGHSELAPKVVSTKKMTVVKGKQGLRVK